MQSKPKVPSREEEEWFRSAVREELSYWNNFLDDIQRDTTFTSKRFTIKDRIDMYIDTVWFMFQAGRLSGLPDTVLLHWYPKTKDTEMCPGCQFMVDNSPYPRDLMPTTPRAGDTPCLMKCVHRVVVRHVPLKEVVRRKKELPSKKVLRYELSKIMQGKRQKYKRRKERAYNPWLGQTTWGELR